MSCQRTCAKLHFLDGSEAWSEKCPTCQTWVVFRNGGCVCCGTSWAKFELKQSYEKNFFEAYNEMDTDEQVEICRRKKNLQLLITLYKAKKPLNTTALLRAAHKSYKYRERLDELIDYGAIRRYMVTGPGCYQYMHELTKNGMYVLKLYRTFRIFNPKWIFPEDLLYWKREISRRMNKAKSEYEYERLEHKLAKVEELQERSRNSLDVSYYFFSPSILEV